MEWLKIGEENRSNYKVIGDNWFIQFIHSNKGKRCLDENLIIHGDCVGCD